MSTRPIVNTVFIAASTSRFVASAGYWRAHWSSPRSTHSRHHAAPAVMISATPPGPGSDSSRATYPRPMIASTATTSTVATPTRRTRFTQSAMRSSRPLCCQVVIRRTTPTSRALPGIDTTKKIAISWATAP
ncbi:hypothetical protein [Frankia sp. QA3]|uniref:hypothetical protein n=1 Tax=Frankia sp. QA3 TaxID=710111 RepID=UPI001E2E9E8A|nr:hypothetical protein [Frankia sp. QA3]